MQYIAFFLISSDKEPNKHFQVSEKWVKTFLKWEIERVLALPHFENVLWNFIPKSRRVTLMTRADVFSILVNLQWLLSIRKKVAYDKTTNFFLPNCQLQRRIQMTFSDTDSLLEKKNVSSNS